MAEAQQGPADAGGGNQRRVRGIGTGVLILAFLLALALGIGGTLAYHQFQKQEPAAVAEVCDCQSAAPKPAAKAPAKKPPVAKAAPAPAQTRRPVATAQGTFSQNVTVNVQGIIPAKVETLPPVTRAPEPATPAAVTDATCPAGVTVAQFVWVPAALDTTAEINGSRVTVRQFIDGLGQGQATDPTSRLFGGAFFARAKAGEITQAGKFPAVMTLERAGSPTKEIWKGEVGAGATRDVAIPDFQVGDTVRVTLQGDFASPRNGVDIHFTRTKEMVGCKLALHAIAAK